MNNKYILGMPTLIELESISDNINLCRELNLDYIEINMNMPRFFLQQFHSDVVFWLVLTAPSIYNHLYNMLSLY